MKYKTIQGKRGGFAGSAVSNFWSYVIFVFVVIIFYVFFQLSGCSANKNRIVDLENQITRDIDLINHLRTPISSDIYGEEIPDDQEKNVADLIIKLYLINDYDKFKSEMIKIRDEFFYGWGRLMILSNYECLYDSRPEEHCQTQRDIGELESIVKLPTPTMTNEFESIQVVLIKYNILD